MILPPELLLGPFAVDHAGMLSPATPETFPRFSVQWYGRLLHACMRQCSAQDPTHGELELSIRLGRVPSSIGLHAAQRIGTLGLAQALPRLMPAAWRWRLRADHSILLETIVLIDLPVSAVSLTTELSIFLLHIAPYLHELDGEGLAVSNNLQ